MICSKCVGEDGLKTFVESESITGKCDYCEETDLDIADAEKVLDLIASCIPLHYEDPANSVGYDSSEGGYLLETMDSREVLEDAGLNEAHDDFLEEAVDKIDEESTDWIGKDPYASSYDEQLIYDWAEFANQVKHRTRYTFFRVKTEHIESGDSAVRQPYEVMEHIGKVIEYAEAFRCLEEGTVLFRARRHPVTEIVSTSQAMGPAPSHLANQNRMSPAGISMFYGALDESTATMEVGALSPDEALTVAQFECRKNLLLIDLSLLPWSDSLFIEEPTMRPEDVRFLRAFREEITKPIVRDNRIHIEYVPTQVITEYFRHLFRTEAPIEGMIYPTSLTATGENVVLFCDEKLGADEDKKSPAWLQMTKCETLTPAAA